MSKQFTIMFVCTGNTCRSPMAEGALRALLEKERPGKSKVISSGTSAASNFPATIYAVEASKIWDVDLSGHKSQPLTNALIDQSDLIFALTPSHLKEVLRIRPDATDKAYLFKNFPDHALEGEAVDDPIGQELQRYNETFLEIGELLGQYLPKIVEKIDGTTDAE